MIYFILVLLGLAIGSFVSVVTYRISRGLNFVVGRSFCDSCKKGLSWYDNIPVFSYIFYHRVTRCCNKKISIRYPLIEIASAVGFVILYLSNFSPIYYILYTVSLAILVIDIEYQIIPDELSWIILFLALFIIHNSLFMNLFSGFIYSFLFLILYLITSGRGMGLGDVKLAIPLGMMLGIEKGFVWLTTSFILGGIVATILLLLSKAKLKSKIAFGPFLVIAFWIVTIYAEIYKI